MCPKRVVIICYLEVEGHNDQKREILRTVDTLVEENDVSQFTHNLSTVINKNFLKKSNTLPEDGSFDQTSFTTYVLSRLV